MNSARLVTALLVGSCMLVAAGDSAAGDAFIVRAVGVGTFGTSMTPLVGGGVGLNITPIIQITVEAAREFGRADPRVAPRPAGNGGTVPTRVIIDVVESGRIDRRLAAGARVRLPDRRLTPFAEFNVGRGRFTSRYWPNGRGYDGSIASRTFVEAGGGISVSLGGRAALEASYRVGQVVERYNQDVVQALGAAIAFGF